jgi:hypothetical protein
MSDRVSTKPPSPYLGTEQAMNAYHEGMNTPLEKGKSDRPRHSRNNSAAQDTSNQRSSGIFRFGKAIVSAFNPVTSWFKGQQDGSSHNAVGKKWEEPVKIEEAYAKLKKSGYKGTRSTIHVDRLQRGEEHQTIIFDMPGQNAQGRGDTSDAEKTPKAQKRYGRIFDTTEAVQSTTSLSSRDRSTSRDTSENESASKPSFHTRRPSMQNLHKVASYLQLPSSKHRSCVSSDVEQDVPPSREVMALQTEAQKFIKQDVRKQKKLSKQVSDLEVKLERARKELEAVTGGAPPVPEHTSKLPEQDSIFRGRKPFVPGALPSLLSESVLNQQASWLEDADDDDAQSSVPSVQYLGQGTRVSTSGAVPPFTMATPKSAANHVHLQDKAKAESPESTGPTPPAKDPPKPATPRKVTKKRKSRTTDEGNSKDTDYRPSSQAPSSIFSDEDDLSDSSPEPAKPTPKKAHQPSKLQKMNLADSPGSAQKKGSITPKKNLNSIYAAGSASRIKSTTDLPSTALRTDDKPRRGRPPKISRSLLPQAKPSSKAAQSAPKTNKSRRTVSPYPFSSPTKTTESGTESSPITIVPGMDIENGDGEKVPPIPPIPKELSASNPRSKKIMFDSENVNKTLKAPKTSAEGKTAQEKMHEKGKMSIADGETKGRGTFEWPDDVF